MTTALESVIVILASSSACTVAKLKQAQRNPNVFIPSVRNRDTFDIRAHDTFYLPVLALGRHRISSDFKESQACLSGKEDNN